MLAISKNKTRAQGAPGPQNLQELLETFLELENQTLNTAMAFQEPRTWIMQTLFQLFNLSSL